MPVGIAGRGVAHNFTSNCYQTQRPEKINEPAEFFFGDPGEFVKLLIMDLLKTSGFRPDFRNHLSTAIDGHKVAC